MNKIVSLILALVMGLSLVACGSSGSSGATNTAPAGENGTATGDSQADWVKLDLNFATYLTEQNPCQGNITTLQEKLDEVMPGYITITTYSNGTLLKGPDIYDGVLNGTCDIGLVQQDYTPSRFPLSRIFSYPGVVYNSAEVATRVFHEWGKTSNADELKDVVFLLGIGSGPYCIFTKEPIKSMSDFAGKQIRAGSVNADVITAYGATAVTMDISEVYEAMRSSLLDGLYTNYGACAYTNLEEVGGHALITPLSSNPSMYVMNKDVFNSMPASQQEAFMNAVDQTFEEYTTVYQDEGLKTQRVVDFGIKVDTTFLEGDKLEEFKAATAYLMDDLVKELDDQGLDGTGNLTKIQALADEYNKTCTWDDYKTYYPEDLDPSNN